MSKLDEILEWYPDDVFGKYDDLDDAIIGVDNESLRLIYSQYKILKILENTHNMSQEEADEYFSFNIAGLYFGENTPIICCDIF